MGIPVSDPNPKTYNGAEMGVKNLHQDGRWRVHPSPTLLPSRDMTEKTFLIFLLKFIYPLFFLNDYYIRIGFGIVFASQK